jgi:hypothetical protein
LHFEINLLTALEFYANVKDDALVPGEILRNIGVQDRKVLNWRPIEENRLDHIAQEFLLAQQEELEDYV